MSAPNYLTTAEVDLEALTPVMRQVVDFKRQHPNALHFVRMGDFYELFFEDAIEAAGLLDLVLTSRNKNDPRPIPMAGVPHHAIETYVERLLECGRRVAIGEQLEDPSKARGTVKRGITHVITPGVVLESGALEERQSNHILALVPGRGGEVGVAVAEVSTGAFHIDRVHHSAALGVLIARLDPREIIGPARFEAALQAVPGALGVLFTPVEPDQAAWRAADDDPAAVAAGLIRAYLAEVRPLALGVLTEPIPLDSAAHMTIGRDAVGHLELLTTARDDRRKGALLAAVDRTRTSAGARLLRSLLVAPLRDRRAIEVRHGAVAALLEDRPTRQHVRRQLDGVADLARIASRAAAGMVTPRELAAARDSLTALPQLREYLGLVGHSVALAGLAADLSGEGELAEMLTKALADEPRNHIADGEVIRPGWSAELDAVVELCRDSHSWLVRFEASEREATGITSLKVRYNRVTGHGIEIPRRHAADVPHRYHRKQTLKHTERYSTPELIDFEDKLSRAEADRLACETRLFGEIVAAVVAAVATIRRIAAALAELDVHASFAEIAAEQGYVQARMTDDAHLVLTGSRHPVVEQMLPAGTFVANDIELDGELTRIVLLTGPNMAGKSTLMRQVALSAILAQAGGFVPATEATLPVFDAVMTRIGAADDISSGASTFMVEMRETAAILDLATPRSLVLLDEIGRGTSTYDGLAIAWAVVERLHDSVGAFCLFATHYHELTVLAERLERLENAHVAVREWGDEIVFVHRLQPGPTNRSHGIAVARLAGLPDAVIERARAVLADLESRSKAVADAGMADRQPRQLSFFDAPQTLPVAAPSPAVASLLTRLAAIDTDDVSPRQAHQLLAELRDSAAALAETNELMLNSTESGSPKHHTAPAAVKKPI